MLRFKHLVASLYIIVGLGLTQTGCARDPFVIVEDNQSVIRIQGPDGLLINRKADGLDAEEQKAVDAYRAKNPPVPVLDRQHARWQRRPLLVNKDGIRKSENTPDTRTALLKGTVNGYQDFPHLTTIILSTGSRFWETQAKDTTGATESFWPSVLEDLAKAHPGDEVAQDPFLLSIDFLKTHKKEVFWTVRVNDTHDHAMEADDLRGWKLRMARTRDADGNPFLVGTQDAPPPYARANAFNYENADVREKFLQCVVTGLRKFAGRHRLDGLEIDFMRHPVLFHSVAHGKKSSRAQRALITDLIRKIRAEMDAIGQERGRPVLLMLRVPDSTAFCRAIGVDLENWLKNDYADMVVNGDYYLLSPWADFAKFCHDYKVPYYACMERRRIEQGIPGTSKSASMSQPIIPAIWRGEALNAWEAGVDGIYIFNRPRARAEVFSLGLHDPQFLKNLPADEITRQTATAPYSASTHPDRWARNWNR